MFVSAFYVTCILLVFIVIARTSEVGDACVLERTGNSGLCHLLSRCQPAIDDIQKNQIFPQTCGFVGTQPIVCCVEKNAVTTTTTTTTTTTPRPRNKNPTTRVGDKCKQKCREYGEITHKKIQLPVLSVGDATYDLYECDFSGLTFVIGGQDAEPKEFPHMALIGYGQNEIAWNCGGSLISEQYVLSAAHCVYHRTFGNAKRVRLGDLNIKREDDDASVQEYNIAEIIPHPDYTTKARYNDIALFKLESRVKFNLYVRPACLHVDYQIPSQLAVATGWGFTEYTGTPSDILQKVILEFFSHDQCNRTFRNHNGVKKGIMDESQVCAGSKSEEKDTCQGDSGGPLQIYNKEVNCTYNVVGVTSFGKSCGFTDIPSVYTRVSHYIKWIEDTVWP